MDEVTPTIKKKRGRRKITPKQREFARKYVELGNATDAYAQSYDVSPETKRETMQVEASRTLSLPHVNKEVERLFGAHGMTMTDVLSIHERNMKQEEHLPTSQRAVTDYYELTGMKKNAVAPTINVAFVVNRANSQEGVEVAVRTPAVAVRDHSTDTHEDDKIIEPSENGPTEPL